MLHAYKTKDTSKCCVYSLINRNPWFPWGVILGRWEKGVGSVGMLACDSMCFAHLYQRGA